MSTLNKRGSSVSATSGSTWASTSNAVDGTFGNNDGTYATWTSSTRNATGYIQLGFDFSSIPAGSTVTSISVSLRHKENSTTIVSGLTMQPFSGGSGIGSAFTCTRATADRTDTQTWTPTLAQLQAGTFVVRVTGTHNNSTNSGVLSIDYVDITVTYDPPVNAGQAAGTGTAYDASVTVSTPGTTVNAQAAGPLGAWRMLLALGTTSGDNVGVAYNATVNQSVAATDAASTGTGNNATLGIKVAAYTTGGAAGVWQGPLLALGMASGQQYGAEGSGTAYDATVTIGAGGTNTNVNPTEATGAGTAYGATVIVSTTSTGAGSGTGVANGATTTVSTSAGQAAGTGTASSATLTISASAGQASGTGAANGATPNQSSTPSTATGTGSASSAQANVAVTAGQASGTGTANGVTPNQSSTPTTAVGTGTAGDATVVVTTTPTTATGTGTGYDPAATTTTVATAGQAAGSGTAFDATLVVTVTATGADGTGTAFDIPSQVEETPTGGAPIVTPRRPRVGNVLVRAEAAYGYGTAHLASIAVDFDALIAQEDEELLLLI